MTVRPWLAIMASQIFVFGPTLLTITYHRATDDAIENSWLTPGEAIQVYAAAAACFLLAAAGWYATMEPRLRRSFYVHETCREYIARVWDTLSDERKAKIPPAYTRGGEMEKKVEKWVLGTR